MNSYTLKIGGTSEIPTTLEMGHDYVVAGKLSVTSIEKIDQENGEFEFCHKSKLHSIELVNKLGKTVKGKAKGSQSQKLRWSIMEKENTEDYYQLVMSKLIENLDEVLTVLKI